MKKMQEKNQPSAGTKKPAPPPKRSDYSESSDKYEDDEFESASKSQSQSMPIV